jgi:nicotinate-nucleotide adenylyltransferase
MRIGFFGGSFDPPHLGHLAVARAAAQAFRLDRILFAPTAHQPLKRDGAAAPFADRLAMVSLLCALQPAIPETPTHNQPPTDTQPPISAPLFEPSTIDAPLPDAAPNYTVDTLARLRRTLPPDDALFAIIGADAFLTLPTWRSPNTLLTLADWIVVSRPGLVLQQLDALSLTPAQRQRVHLLNGVNEPASATTIRTLLLSRADCTGLLPPSVLDYIRAHHLYGI